jgi:methyl-accepting chemotaxis protein
VTVEFASAEQAALINAIDRSHAIIEFGLDGTIVSANDLFLQTIGYGRDEIVGKNHAMLVSVEYAQSLEYRDFWDRLRAGDYLTGDFPRLAKGRREVWLHAIYNPVLDDQARPVRIVKIATDITRDRRHRLDVQSQIDALHRSTAVVEFNLQGEILKVNGNFLKLTGYSEVELIGRPHRMFVDPAETSDKDYAAFWRGIANGQFRSEIFRRIGKGGRPFWIRASYNPVVDEHGRLSKIVKFAFDMTQAITDQQNYARAVEDSEEMVRSMLIQVGSVAAEIESITRQSKLLAINARIEAARVGDVGRSFAVVAGEMSSLSMRTAASAKAISAMVQDHGIEIGEGALETPLARKAAAS